MATTDEKRGVQNEGLQIITAVPGTQAVQFPAGQYTLLDDKLTTAEGVEALKGATLYLDEAEARRLCEVKMTSQGRPTRRPSAAPQDSYAAQLARKEVEPIPGIRPDATADELEAINNSVQARIEELRKNQERTAEVAEQRRAEVESLQVQTAGPSQAQQVPPSTENTGFNHGGGPEGPRLGQGSGLAETNLAASQPVEGEGGGQQNQAQGSDQAAQNADDVNFASDAARREAEKLGVDATTITGTGNDGSVTKNDVRRAAGQPPAE